MMNLVGITQELYSPNERVNIAKEDISSALSNLYNGATSNIKSFTSKLKEVLPDLKSVITISDKNLDSSPSTQFDKNTIKFLQTISKHSYSDIKELKAFRPEDLNCSYLDFIDYLNKEINYCTTVQGSVLKPYLDLLGNVLSKSDFNKTTDTNSRNYKKIRDRRELAIKNGVKLYKENNSPICIVKDVVQRNDDWKSILSKLNTTLIEANNIKRKAIHQDIDHCALLIDEIINKLNNEEGIEISPELLDNVITGTIECAKEVEYVAIIHYRLLTLKGCIENTMSHIEKVYA